MHPDLKVIWSFGGWTWSGGFTRGGQEPGGLRPVLLRPGRGPAWADVFDGIDIDWEYPNACGPTCDTSGRDAFRNLMSALRAKFGSGNLVTAAITADATAGGKIDAADYAGAAQYVDWYNPMTYDYFGAWAATGPDGPALAADVLHGIPKAGLQHRRDHRQAQEPGHPGLKLLLGIGFYGRGWTGVTQAAPGGTATGPAAGTYEAGHRGLQGAQDHVPGDRHGGRHRVRQVRQPVVELRHPGDHRRRRWRYKNAQGLGGTFFWELSGDTANGELIKAIN